LVVAPTTVAAALGGPTDDRTVSAMRLLGARHLIQASASALDTSPRFLVGGGLLDAAHSTSMVFLGAIDPTRRRLAWLDSVVESGWSAASLHLGRQI
jgi:hypothetical protein